MAASQAEMVWVGNTISCAKILYPDTIVHTLASDAEEARTLGRVRLANEFVTVTIPDKLCLRTQRCIFLGIVKEKKLEEHVRQAIGLRECTGVGLLVQAQPDTKFIEELTDWACVLKELPVKDGIAVFVFLTRGKKSADVQRQVHEVCQEELRKQTTKVDAVLNPSADSSTMELCPAAEPDSTMAKAMEALQGATAEQVMFIDGSRKKRKLATEPPTFRSSSRMLMQQSGKIYLLGWREGLMILGWPSSSINLHLAGSRSVQQGLVSSLLPRPLVAAVCAATLRLCT